MMPTATRCLQSGIFSRETSSCSGMSTAKSLPPRCEHAPARAAHLSTALIACECSQYSQCMTNLTVCAYCFAEKSWANGNIIAVSGLRVGLNFVALKGTLNLGLSPSAVRDFDTLSLISHVFAYHQYELADL